MTRLLNTPIIGPSVAIVDSSWIDMLAGLVISGIRRMPPDFCANAGAVAAAIAKNAAIATDRRNCPRIAFPPWPCPCAVGPALLYELQFKRLYLSSHTSSIRQPL